jgi:hypothetical protein
VLSTTADFYTSVLPQLAIEAAEAVTKIVPAAPGTPENAGAPSGHPRGVGENVA